MITKGFWENRQNLNIESSIPAVISSFEDTGRVWVLTKYFKKKWKVTYFWGTRLSKMVGRSLFDSLN